MSPWTVAAILGVFQARILEWVAISFFRRFSYLGIEPMGLASPALVGGFLTTEPPEKWIMN